MNKEDFLIELKENLNVLSSNEISDIIQYFSEFFEDSEKSDSEIIETFGEPKKLANKIISDLDLSTTFESTNKPKSQSNFTETANIIPLEKINRINIDLKNSTFEIIRDSSLKENIVEIKKRDALSEFKYNFNNDLFELVEETELTLNNFLSNLLTFNRGNSVTIRLKSDFNLSNLNIISKNSKVILYNVNISYIDIYAKNGKVECHYINSTDIKTIAKNGKIEIKNLTSDNLDLDAKNGKIELNDVTSKNIKADSKNGKIEFNKVNCVNQYLNSKNGAIFFIGNSINSTADSKNGSIKFFGTVENELNLINSNGSITVDTKTLGKTFLKTTHGSIKVNSTLTDKLEAYTTHGSINISTNLNPNELDIEAKTDMGNVVIYGEHNSTIYVQNYGRNPKITARTSHGNINIK